MEEVGECTFNPLSKLKCHLIQVQLMVTRPSRRSWVNGAQASPLWMGYVLSHGPSRRTDEDLFESFWTPSVNWQVPSCICKSMSSFLSFLTYSSLSRSFSCILHFFGWSSNQYSQHLVTYLDHITYKIRRWTKALFLVENCCNFQTCHWYKVWLVNLIGQSLIATSSCLLYKVKRSMRIYKA